MHMTIVDRFIVEAAVTPVKDLPESITNSECTLQIRIDSHFSQRR